MIITLYKDTFYNGLGQPVTIGPGDVLTRRIPDDGSFELTATLSTPVVPTRADAQVGERLLAVAKGCHDYSGGHRGEQYEAFQHGINTVVRSLEAAMKNDPNDTQVNALERMGRATRSAEPVKEERK